MKNTKLISWCITLCCFTFVRTFVETIVVTRSTRDLFSNPIDENCINNDEYCLERKATCLGGNCCTCRCKSEYSTFHSPGVTYYQRDGRAAYKFDAKESCAWNHYAHEGCRFIEEHPSNLSTRFLPLINLNKNGSLGLKTTLDDIYQCDHYRLFSRRPLDYGWVEFDGEIFFQTAWSKSADVHLRLKWTAQGPIYGGLLLKLNFSCEMKEYFRIPEPCVILKIEGIYNTRTNASQVLPITTPTTTETPLQLLSPDNLNTSAAQAKPTTVVVLRRSTSQTSTMSGGDDDMMNTSTETSAGNAVSDKNATTSEETQGKTFWVLVYIFMGFAIFEVIFVAFFLLYRQRKRKRRKNLSKNETATTQTSADYENHGMTVSSESSNNVSSIPENIQLYENKAYIEPRHPGVKRMGTFRKDGDLAAAENGMVEIQVNKNPSEQGSTGNPKVLSSGSIIVLPKDCVIVHTSGSRTSRRNEQEGEGVTRHNDEAIEKDDPEPHNSENTSLSSWESFSTFYRTSTDEDYVSGGNPTVWENDSLYEVPDNMPGPKQQRRPPPLPPKTYGLKRLFALRETAIAAANDDDNNEHIYETAENVISDDDFVSSYYENAYDLPEDAIIDCQIKHNIGSLRHILDKESAEEETRNSSLNLGNEFVNNATTSVHGYDATLMPKRQSTLYLRETSEKNLQNRTSVC